MSDLGPKALLERHAAFWTREPVDKPLLHVSSPRDETAYQLEGISIPLADGTILSEQDAALTPDMIDPQRILDVDEFPRRPQTGPVSGPRTVDDLLVVRTALWKIPWLEAILGCQVVPKLDTGSMYSVPYLEGPERLSAVPPPSKSPWLELLLEYIRLLAEDSKGSYQVVQCLQRGPIDLASALLGHSEMCFAIYDRPAELQALNELCAEAFIAVAKAQESNISPLNGGRCTAFGLWAPGTVVRTQCDVTSSVSADMYEEYFFPYDLDICGAFDYSVVHLHSGYLHTVDTFLKNELPTAIQVSLDTGSTPYTVHDLVPVFARILEEKPLLVQGRMTARELDEILERLPAKGLYVSTAVPDYD